MRVSVCLSSQRGAVARAKRPGLAQQPAEFFNARVPLVKYMKAHSSVALTYEQFNVIFVIKLTFV